MNILLIEPDRVLAHIYITELERAGHAVRHAVSAQSAVHAADEQQPDVVIVELQLPRHNGIEFLYEFRSYAEWQHIPVIIHTFVPAAELARAAVLRGELGVAAVLYKPAATLAQLSAAVERLKPARL